MPTGQLVVGAANQVAPHMFKGGTAAEYVVRVGTNGTLNTLHLPSGQSIQSVVPALQQGASQALGAASNLVPILAAANLGVGLLNLGVSAYTAYKVHKLSNAVDGVKADTQQLRLDVTQLRMFVTESFGEVKSILNTQSLALGILQTQHAAMNEKLDVLRALVERGFHDTHRHILDAQAQREQHEMDERLGTVLHHYSALSDIVAEGHEPDHGSTRTVIDEGVRALAWVDARLRQLPLAESTRLPFLIAKRGVLQMMRNARQFETGGSVVSTREEADLAREISAQARVLCENRLLYELATEYQVLLAQHVFLRRSLRCLPDLSTSQSGQAIPLFSLDDALWNDRLSPLRQLSAGGPSASEATVIPIGSLEDREWLCDWQGVPVSDYEHVARDEVPIREVLATIGVAPIADVQVTEEVIAELKRLVTAPGREGIASHLARELEMEAPPRLRGGNEA